MRELLKSLPIEFAPVIKNAAFESLDEIFALIKQSRFISGEGHLDELIHFCESEGIDAETAIIKQISTR